MTSKKKNQVWVITHCEIDGKSFDRLPFHASSTLEVAKKLVARVKVNDFSWWEVFRLEQDFNLEKGWEDSEVHYFTHKGKKVKSPPMEKAQKAYQKFLKSAEGQPGGCCGQAMG